LGETIILHQCDCIFPSLHSVDRDDVETNENCLSYGFDIFRVTSRGSLGALSHQMKDASSSMLISDHPPMEPKESLQKLCSTSTCHMDTNCVPSSKEYLAGLRGRSGRHLSNQMLSFFQHAGGTRRRISQTPRGNDSKPPIADFLTALSQPAANTLVLNCIRLDWPNQLE
jgi:hypothetical protein